MSEWGGQGEGELPVVVLSKCWVAAGGGTAGSSCSKRGGYRALDRERERERERGEGGVGVWSFQVSFYSVQISLLEDKYLANT